MATIRHTAKSELTESDCRYFSAGSQNEKILGGTLSVLFAYKSLPAGCVMHNIEPNRIRKNPKSWLLAVERMFRSKGCRLCRFYLLENTEDLRADLKEMGCRPKKEIGFYINLGKTGIGNFLLNENLVAVKSEQEWVLKRSLYNSTRNGPDGHDMNGAAFASMERIKCDAGYMVSYLFF